MSYSELRTLGSKLNICQTCLDMFKAPKPELPLGDIIFSIPSSAGIHITSGKWSFPWWLCNSLASLHTTQKTFDISKKCHMIFKQTMISPYFATKNQRKHWYITMINIRLISHDFYPWTPWCQVSLADVHLWGRTGQGAVGMVDRWIFTFFFGFLWLINYNVLELDDWMICFFLLKDLSKSICLTIMVIIMNHWWTIDEASWSIDEPLMNHWTID